MTTYSVKTFGCKVNSYDTGLLQDKLNNYGFSFQKDTPDVCIFNTCSVTQQATREALRQIRRFKTKNVFSKIVVTGCAAQVDTEFFTNLSGVDLIIANSHKSQLPVILDDYLKGKVKQKVFKSNIFKKTELEPHGGREISHTRSFLKIQDGCNSFCTFCVIPFARGKSRSIPVEMLIEKINVLSEQKVKEVVLTGVHIGDYKDKNQDLSDLVKAVLLKTNIPRIRLSSLEPIEITDGLLECYEDERMCRHFHMSIQSCDSNVLKNMKRQYNAQDVSNALEKIQNKVSGAFVGMDVIVGFPNETEKQFENTCQRLSQMDWTQLHVFPYSERPGTYAVRLKDKVSPTTIQKRAKKLRQLSQQRYFLKAQSQIGCFKKVLVLKNGTQGLSRDYWKVIFKKPHQLSDFEKSVTIKGYDFKTESLMA